MQSNCMNENSIKFQTNRQEFRFEYGCGDEAFFFVWKTAGLEPEQISRVPNPHIL